VRLWIAITACDVLLPLPISLGRRKVLNAARPVFNDPLQRSHVSAICKERAVFDQHEGFQKRTIQGIKNIFKASKNSIDSKI
jgi:hypothetical protein